MTKFVGIVSGIVAGIVAKVWGKVTTSLTLTYIAELTVGLPFDKIF